MDREGRQDLRTRHHGYEGQTRPCPDSHQGNPLGTRPARAAHQSNVFNSDEETGSHTSLGLIQSLAKEHDLVLCLEPALSDGALKTWRKGIGDFDIEVSGKMAHAGANPSNGVNAIHEIAYQIQEIAELRNEQAGTTLNVDLIQGGTRTNVIAAHAQATVDIRVLTEDERSRVDAGLKSLKSRHPGAQLTVTGEWNRPPMPRTEAMIQNLRTRKRDQCRHRPGTP